MNGALHQIRDAAGQRAGRTVAAVPAWPCRKGCDDCCRSLAAAPVIRRVEWESIAAALDSLPPDVADAARDSIRESAGAPRPVTCPLLDAGTGACLVYDARPVACRAYGFYAGREGVLGCARIESIACERPEVVWGNYEAIEERLRALGPEAPVAAWLNMLEQE